MGLWELEHLFDRCKCLENDKPFDKFRRHKDGRWPFLQDSEYLRNLDLEPNHYNKDDRAMRKESPRCPGSVKDEVSHCLWEETGKETMQESCSLNGDLLRRGSPTV